MAYTEADLLGLLKTALGAGTETQNVEFKDGRGGRVHQELWKSISAFSHDPKGGVIFFGVSEDQNGHAQVTGGLDLALYQQRISNYFSDIMTNAAPPEMYIVSYESHNLLAVIVKPLSDERKPCFNRSLGLPNGACVRVGNTNRVISMDEMNQFIRNAAPFRFDRTTVPGVLLGDLSTKKLSAFFERSASRAGRTFNGMTEQVLISAGIIHPDGRSLLATVGGYLVFSSSEPQNLPEFKRLCIRCVCYKGNNPGSPIVDKRDITGTLDVQIEEVQKFILRNIALEARIIGSKRVEDYEYPEEAIREVVANAVIHRDYQVTETYTQIAVFSNHIEVTNPGNLPPGINIDNLKNSQFSRNEVIAQLLRDMNYMEEYGRGIDLIYSRMRERGLLDPIFRNVANSFRVTLLGRNFSRLNARQLAAWQEFQKSLDSRITVAEYAEKFSVSRPTANNDLLELVELSLLKREGAGPNTYYVLNF